MPRWNSFGRSAVFAAGAAAAAPVVWLGLGPVIGVADAFSLLWVATIAVYVAGIAPAPHRGLAAGAGALVLGGLLSIFAASAAQVALLSALALAIFRSGLLYRARPLRAIALESALGLGGLALAALAQGPGLPGPLGAAFGLWSFLLVQSTFFLVGGIRRRERDPDRDPFELARSRLLGLLED